MKDNNLLRLLDWPTICIYVSLVLAGWFCIYGASFDFSDSSSMFSFSNWAGKQLVWIGCGIGLAAILLLLDDSLYFSLATMLYIGMMIILLITPFLATDIKGSLSWIKLGSISIQPAEFAKFVTALALAKYIDTRNFNARNARDTLMAACIILLPMILIMMQKETGSALIYLAFFLVLYREGLSGVFLLLGICAIVFFIVEIRYGGMVMPDNITSWGGFMVYLLIIIFTSFLLMNHAGDTKASLYILGVGGGFTILATLFSTYVIPFNVSIVMLVICGIIILSLIILFIHTKLYKYLFVAFFTIGSICFSYSVDTVFNHVLKPHQKIRIEVVLGMEEDLAGAGYNVNQSKIAIGSGGLFGKGFLKGTQTKLKYVPEQHTDFIFCTMGEEQGFIGSSAVLILFLLLILRLIKLAERQKTRFGRVFGYSVLSIIFFHLFINIGMVIGLTPVIGIPLPFFSYGGSSLWGFTILLFVFLRIDCASQRR